MLSKTTWKDMHQTEYRLKDPYKSFPDFKKQDDIKNSVWK